MKTQRAIANIAFAVDALNSELFAVTTPLGNLVGEGAIEILHGRTASLRALRAKIALGRLQTLRNQILALKHDAAFWSGVTELLNAPDPAITLVVDTDGSHEPPLPAA